MPFLQRDKNFSFSCIQAYPKRICKNFEYVIFYKEPFILEFHLPLQKLFANICAIKFLIFSRITKIYQNKWIRAFLQVPLRKSQLEDRNLRKKIWFHTQILKVSYTIFQVGKNPSCVNAEWENFFWRFFDSITGWPRPIFIKWHLVTS